MQKRTLSDLMTQKMKKKKRNKLHARAAVKTLECHRDLRQMILFASKFRTKSKEKKTSFFSASVITYLLHNQNITSV